MLKPCWAKFDNLPKASNFRPNRRRPVFCGDWRLHRESWDLPGVCREFWGTLFWSGGDLKLPIWWRGTGEPGGITRRRPKQVPVLRFGDARGLRTTRRFVSLRSTTTHMAPRHCRYAKSRLWADAGVANRSDACGSRGDSRHARDRNSFISFYAANCGSLH